MIPEIVPDIRDHAKYGRPVAVVRLPSEMRSLSSAVVGGGLASAASVVIQEVPLDYDHDDPVGELSALMDELDAPRPCVGLMTAAYVRNVITVERAERNGVSAVAIVTAGTTNAVTAGERVSASVASGFAPHKAGTINIIAIVDAPLSDSGLANAVMTVTEAKTAGMADAGIAGTGTTSDAVVVLCPPGGTAAYAGTASDAGVALARAVRAATSASIVKWTNGKRAGAKDFVTKLDEMGIGLEEMWGAALGLYCPNPDWPTEMIRERFERQLRILRDDVNVNAMVFAAIRMEEMGQRDEMHGLDEGRFKEDPVHLVADELLGIALAQYVAGTKGLFEYIRYDKKKPGILGVLGPFLDDIVGSLIGSIMSRIYTDLLESEGKLVS